MKNYHPSQISQTNKNIQFSFNKAINHIQNKDQYFSNNPSFHKSHPQASNNQSDYNSSIKQYQMLNHALDTIDSKINNKQQLKQSLNSLDRQFIININYQSQKNYGNNRSLSISRHNQAQSYNKNGKNYEMNTISYDSHQNLSKTIKIADYRRSPYDNGQDKSTNRRQQKNQNIIFNQNYPHSSRTSPVRYASNSHHNKNMIHNKINFADRQRNQNKSLHNQNISIKNQNKSVNNNFKIKIDSGYNYNNQCNNRNQPDNKHISKKHQLKIPKPNTLTDQFLKLTLGCQKQLIEQYNNTINPKQNNLPQNNKGLTRQNTQIVKQKFKQFSKEQTEKQNYLKKIAYQKPQSNNHINNKLYQNFDEQQTFRLLEEVQKPCVNISMPQHFTMMQSSLPVYQNNYVEPFYDQTYYNYLKTNMKYISQLSVNKERNTGNNVNTQHSPSNLHKKGLNIQNGQYHQNLPYKNNENIYSFNSPISIKFQKQQNQNVAYRTSNNLNHQEEIALSNISYPSQIQPQPQKIIKKLKQTGGIQNTIQFMQRSLKKNELKNLKKNQYIIGNGMVENKLLLDSDKDTSVRYKTGSFHNISQNSSIKIPKSSKINISNNPNVINNNRKHNHLTLDINDINNESNALQNTNVDKNNYFSSNSSNNIHGSTMQLKKQYKNWRQRSESLRHKIQQNMSVNKLPKNKNMITINTRSIIKDIIREDKF